MKNGFQFNMDEAILAALREDITSEDITTAAVIDAEVTGRVELICKQDGILAGIEVFARTFELMDTDMKVRTTYQDGDPVTAGTKIANVNGSVRALLGAERTALNFLQRMSGIATLTKRFVDVLQETGVRLLDTRKTTPNMRLFEKYAVKVGGGTNHRYNLSDGILLKDNHIDAAGSVAAAVRLAKAYAPFVRKIEVEVENLEMLEEALAAGADIIMLDNMDAATMKEAVALTAGRAELECSGNVDEARLKEIAATGVDYISCGALTHSAPILDFSMKHLTLDA